MIIAHHLILTGYGHWLSNDPRGSMSMKTYCSELAKIAKNHFGRRKSQPSRSELRTFYKEAQKNLAHPVLWWNDMERQALVEAFDAVINFEKLTCYACAILPNHIHLLIRKHRLKAEEMSSRLKDAGRLLLCEKSLAPVNHPVFSADSCHVYKSEPHVVQVCVAYIQRNYLKHNLAPIHCAFVSEYDNWPLHKQTR